MSDAEAVPGTAQLTASESRRGVWALLADSLLWLSSTSSFIEGMDFFVMSCISSRAATI